jgi:hypothetical protein
MRFLHRFLLAIAVLALGDAAVILVETIACLNVDKSFYTGAMGVEITLRSFSKYKRFLGGRGID